MKVSTVDLGDLQVGVPEGWERLPSEQPSVPLLAAEPADPPLFRTNVNVALVQADEGTDDVDYARQQIAALEAELKDCRVIDAAVEAPGRVRVLATHDIGSFSVTVDQLHLSLGGRWAVVTASVESSRLPELADLLDEMADVARADG